MMKDIEKIRKDAIAQIKEKIKKNSGYLHPCNKDRQEDMKKLEFANGNDFINWMQQNGIMKNTSDISKQDRERWARDAGFNDWKEYGKLWMRDNSTHSMSENENCSLFFGVYIGERLFKIILEENMFEYVGTTGKSSHDGGIDFICKYPIQEFIDRYPQLKLERYKEYKIQLRMKSLMYYKVDISNRI